jgi:hypothetical protein
MTSSTASLPGRRDDAPAITAQPERRQGLLPFVGASPTARRSL